MKENRQYMTKTYSITIRNWLSWLV